MIAKIAADLRLIIDRIEVSMRACPQPAVQAQLAAWKVSLEAARCIVLCESFPCPDSKGWAIHFINGPWDGRDDIVVPQLIPRMVVPAQRSDFTVMPPVPTELIAKSSIGRHLYKLDKKVLRLPDGERTRFFYRWEGAS